MIKKRLCIILSALLSMSVIIPVSAQDPEVTVSNDSESISAISTDKEVGADVDSSDGSQSSLTVQNDVVVICSDVTTQKQATGIAAHADDGGSADVNVGGSVNVSGNENIVAIGISTNTDGEGSSSVNAGGVTSESETGSACGILADVRGASSASFSIGSDGINVTGANATGADILADGPATVNVNIDGNIVTNNTEASPAPSGLDLKTSGSEAEINVRVGGDITNNGLSSSSVEIVATSGSTVNVVAEGTLSVGTESAIAFSGDPDNISLVIWKFAANSDDSLVKEAVVYEGETELVRNANAIELEQSIHYIIKMDTAQNIELGGTTGMTYTAPDGSVKRYNTAKESEEVAVKLTIPSGYDLAGVFSDKERQCRLEQNANGNYYLVVPKGGGIYVNMLLVPHTANAHNADNEATIRNLQQQFEAFKEAQEKNNATLTNEKNALSNQLANTQKSLNEAVKARDTYKEKYANATKGPARPETPSRAAALSKNNAVGNGNGGYVAQGGHVQINGGKSNVTFTLAAPSAGVLNSATKQASSVGGTLLHCVTTSSPGVSFKSAVVNFTVTGVTANDTIAVYQLQGKSWVQVLVSSITDNHVTVNLTQHGPLAFVRVASVAISQ